MFIQAKSNKFLLQTSLLATEVKTSNKFFMAQNSIGFDRIIGAFIIFSTDSALKSKYRFWRQSVSPDNIRNPVVKRFIRFIY